MSGLTAAASQSFERWLATADRSHLALALRVLFDPAFADQVLGVFPQNGFPPGPPLPCSYASSNGVSSSSLKAQEEPHGASGFATFWKLYPKRVGKGAASRAWRKHQCEKHATKIVLAVESQLAYLTRENGRFTPNPATWLNERRWDDEPPEESAALVDDRNAQAAKEFLGNGNGHGR
jgi:hypothetical protein